MTLSRLDKILFHVNTHGRGLEIGPGFQPVLPKSKGYSVETIDYCSREDLIEKFADDPVDTSLIEAVDYVWRGETLPDLIPEHSTYDYIIASHVIEHTPDLIGFMQDVSVLLNQTGVLSLAIPDKRYCFDHFRPETGLGRIIDAHFPRQTRHSPGTGVEHFLSYVSNHGHPGWNSDVTPDFTLNHSVTEARQLMDEILQTEKYFDLHAWCFTPASFTWIIGCLNEIGLSDLYIKEIFPTVGFEFFVSLSKEKPEHSLDRLTAMQAMDQKKTTATPQDKRTWNKSIKQLLRRIHACWHG